MFFIRIAKLKVLIKNRYGYVEKLCRNYMIDGCSEEDADIVTFASEEQIDAELDIAENTTSRGYAEGICIYRNLCRELPKKFDAYLFHSALIEYEGRGYAFAAQSGTGKSTHISIWQKIFGDKVRIINGDKPIFRYMDGKFIAYGTPWCGKENFNINDSVELSAICFLERAKVNSIMKISPQEALMRLFYQLLAPEDIETVDTLFPLLDKTLSIVPCYILRCNMEDDAAIVAYNGMKN